MNTAEKIVSVYLRLNGFFILNQFTHLPKSGHSQESDLIAIRCPNSKEIVNGKRLQIDENFFTRCVLNKDKIIGLIVEIKAPAVKPTFKSEKIEYAKKFFGDFKEKVYCCDVSRRYVERVNTSYTISFGK